MVRLRGSPLWDSFTPRRPRPDRASVPQHVVQGRNDQRPCFYVADDYADGYLSTCYRYIELNPVPAAKATDPADYPW